MCLYHHMETMQQEKTIVVKYGEEYSNKIRKLAVQ